MVQLTSRDRELVQRAYDRAQLRLASLTTANNARESELRTESIAWLSDTCEQIEDMDFPSKNDFEPIEIDELLVSAEELDAAENALIESDQCTRHELEADLASLLQDIMTDRYAWLLGLTWISERIRYKWLPKEVPPEVLDEFNLGMFNKCQIALNQIALRVEVVAAEHCLNSDDYSPLRFGAIKLRGASLSAADASASYVAAQQLHAAAQAARAEGELSLGGKVWAIVGWDSPWDFAVDVALGLATGGASKVLRWGKRLTKLKVVSKLERALEIEKRLDSLVERARHVRRTAERLRKASKWARIPQDIVEMLKALKTIDRQTKNIDLIGSVVNREYLRSVTSSLVAKGFVAGAGTRGSTLSKNALLAMIRQLLDASHLGLEIDRARARVSFVMLLKDGVTPMQVERFHNYFALVLARELIGRWIYSGAHAANRGTKALAEELTKDFSDAFMSALESVMMELPMLRPQDLVWIKRTISSTLSKIVSEYAKLAITRFYS